MEKSSNGHKTSPCEQHSSMSFAPFEGIFKTKVFHSSLAFLSFISSDFDFGRNCVARRMLLNLF